MHRLTDSSGAVEGYHYAAREALERFAIATAQLTLIHISENVSFRVAGVNGELYALRLHRQGYHDLQELQSEQLWRRALAQTGLRVSESILTRDGSAYVGVTVAATGEQRWASLSRWLDGTSLKEAIADAPPGLDVVKHFVTLGTLLAKAHNQAHGWDYPPGFVRPKLDADGLMGTAPVWGPFWDYRHLQPFERALLLRVRVKLHAFLSSYRRSPDIFTLIHADLHVGNLILQGPQMAIIDFDDAAFGWHQFDIAVALLMHRSDRRVEAFKAALLAGYQSVRLISQLDLALLPLFMLVRGMNQLGWFQQRPEIPEPPSLNSLKNWVCETASEFERVL